MRRNAGTRHSGTTGPTGPHRHPSPTEVVALVNGVTASIGGTYVVTSSVLITALAGVLAAVVVALHLRSGS
ncbi:hypothetical protein IPZ58_31960 [Streptomyces roseoverticillatus]|uniref:hypothetical protein n=1 Tax=Streptomyces roseoverticillatus TaxID=66429 RepID=UPI001F2D2AC2|nr:hypothetical protein [Streptomyces roseoverticillatus]MCF3106153.1 hypothetical protein [Streptomyces roseoverticillatus]